MSDEFTTNENGSKTPEETNFQDYTAPENEIVQNETSQMTQEQPETSYGATSAEENPQPDNTAYAYGQTAYQQAYQSEQSQPNAYQQAYYGQTQAKGTGTGFGIASLVLGILSVFTFACCINLYSGSACDYFRYCADGKEREKGAGDWWNYYSSDFDCSWDCRFALCCEYCGKNAGPGQSVLSVF